MNSGGKNLKKAPAVISNSQETQTLSTLDLFAGCGGLSNGFSKAGFSTLFANEFEAPAVECFKQNHESALVSGDSILSLDAASIRSSLGLRRGRLDAVIGGPPCQGFSTYGQRSEADERNQLYVPYFKFVEEFRPKAFVLENVRGMLSLSGGAVHEDIVRRGEQLGYAVNTWVLNAADFGVPQYRRRVFVVGIEGANHGPTAPQPSHSSSASEAKRSEPQLELISVGTELRHAVTVRDAIDDLPIDALLPSETNRKVDYARNVDLSDYQLEMRGTADKDGVYQHSAKQMLGIRRIRLALLRPGDYGTTLSTRMDEQNLSHGKLIEILNDSSLRDNRKCRSEDRDKEAALRSMLESKAPLEELREILTSQGFANKYRRLKWDSPSHTLVAHMARDCSDFVHPFQDRFITVREAARLQSFSDDFVFTGSQFRQLRQIGNAVPPLLAKAVAQQVSSLIA